LSYNATTLKAQLSGPVLLFNQRFQEERIYCPLVYCINQHRKLTQPMRPVVPNFWQFSRLLVQLQLRPLSLEFIQGAAVYWFYSFKTIEAKCAAKYLLCSRASLV
jgi:hypothetical protein